MDVFKTVHNTQPLDALTNALHHCWRIAEPVYQGMQDGVSVVCADYYFILKCGREVDLVIVPDGETVRQLIRTQNLKVVEAFHVVAECD